MFSEASCNAKCWFAVLRCPCLTARNRYPRRQSRSEQPTFCVTLVSLEILHRSFVFLRRCPRSERSEVLALARFRILFLRVEPILPGLQFADHPSHPLIFYSTRGCKAVLLLPGPLLLLLLCSATQLRRISSGALQLVNRITGIEELARRGCRIDAVIKNSSVGADVNRTSPAVHILLAG
jgi:hypothetical protein